LGSFTLTLAHVEGLEFILESTTTAPGSLCKFTQQPTHSGVTFADTPTFSLACRFVVARTEANPGRTLKNTDVLLLDDWGMAAMDNQTRADLLEVIDDWASHRATIQSPASYPSNIGASG
jgi:hypothetical protein